jgi:hypothetical protein
VITKYLIGQCNAFSYLWYLYDRVRVGAMSLQMLGINHG